MSKPGKYQKARKHPLFLWVFLILIVVALVNGISLLAAPKIADWPARLAYPKSIELNTIKEVKTMKPANKSLPTAPPYLLPEEILASMTLEQKVYQLFICRPEDIVGGFAMTSCPENLSELLEEKPVGGFILFSDNLIDRSKTISLIEECQAASQLPLFIGVDEEGGIVSRVGSNPDMGTSKIPPMGSVREPSAAKNIGQTIGLELRAMGFNLDFAPVADINSNPDNPIIGSRAFSSDPIIAAQMVEACVAGFEASHLLSCLKHFPGHGDTAEDSHYGYAASYKTIDQLRQVEFLPFSAGIAANAPMVMLGHITLPKVAESEGMPASMSSFWIQDILRRELGFQGLITTDSLEMGAITSAYPQKGDSALAALMAGVDIILMPDSLSKGAAAIIHAVETGKVPESRIDESVLRILVAKDRYGILNKEVAQ